MTARARPPRPRPDTGREDDAPSASAAARRNRVRQLSGTDLVVVTMMAVIPTLFVLALVWLPAIGVGAALVHQLERDRPAQPDQGHRPDELHQRRTNYPPFWPALRHNLIWLAVLFLIATPIGMFLAVLLDKEMRFSRFYQTAFYLPVVLSLALVGFIWQLIYSRDQGLLNAVLHTQVDWYGDPNFNLWAALRGHQLAAHRLHHAAVPGRAEGGRPGLCARPPRSTAPRGADVLPASSSR